MGNFLISPLIHTRGVDSNHDVVVIVHDGIGTQVNGEYRTDQLDTIHDPLAAVFEVKPCKWIGPAKEVEKMVHAIWVYFKLRPRVIVRSPK